MWALGLLSLLVSLALAIGQKPTINFDGTGITLASGGSAVQIMAAAEDWPAVLRVCDDLSMDFGRVTGTNGSVTLLKDSASPEVNASMIFNVTSQMSFRTTGSSYGKGGVIITGTVGNSSIIDRLVSEGKIDVSAIKGTWEAYTSALVPNPVPGVSWAMVIAGTLGGA